jgi:FkbM family methyltransferase
MFFLAKSYAFLYFLMKRYFGVHLPGLGRISRAVKKSRIINLKGLKLFFMPEVASEYGTHLIGNWQEPETHGFFRKIFEGRHDSDGLFIDVGSNIGVFLLDVSKLSKFKVVGFEPSSDCIKATQHNMKLNEINNFELHNVLLGSSNKDVLFNSSGSMEGASVYDSSETSKIHRMVTMDSIDSIQSYSGKNSILLIDVEGYELEVIKGGKFFIKNKAPLIIFEFNHVSRKHFTLDQILDELGPDYSLYRLRKDSYLDLNFNHTWNCVAVSKNSQYKDICAKLVINRNICDSQQVE